MDFFEHQELARRNSRRLIGLMTLAVLALIAMTTLVILLGVVGMGPEQLAGGWPAFLRRHWTLLLWVGLGVGALVLAGGLFRWFQLRHGGAAVAEALGGQLIPGNSDDPHERKLLNVVEEMAIAAGTPVPAVYRLDEAGINAFAAGHGPHDAVIGVTRGAMENLSRDELQGVIAHEFSHILHGDMRLNLRLVAAVNGLVMITLLGRLITYGSLHRGRNRGRNRGKQVLIGLALMALGAVGSFFGNWIKAAVSRQREFLADASAVQYTRNPRGIGGALIKLGRGPQGGQLESADAEEFSHMYFGEGVHHAFARLMATHPPLNQRIERVLPGWDGELSEAEPAPGDTADAASGFAAGTAGEAASASQPGPTGEPTPDNLAQARHLLAGMPMAVREATHEPYSARAVAIGLVLGAGNEPTDGQWQQVREALTEAEWHELAPAIRAAAELPDPQRLPVMEMALPSLSALSAPQRQALCELLEQLIREDDRVHLREWVMHRLVLIHLAPPASGGERLKLPHCQKETGLLLAVAALSGSSDEAQARAAFEAAAADLSPRPSWPEREALSFHALDRALTRLRRLRPLAKPVLLKALRQCLEHDGLILPAEAELYRALADSLDCPTPPLPAGEASGPPTE